MKKTIMAFLFSLFPIMMQGLNPSRRAASMEIARLKMSLLYIKSIETSRLLFISLLGIGVCLVFMTIGLIIFHATLFLYAPWSAATKMYVGFAFTAIYFSIAGIAFSYVFSQDKWLKIFHADSIINSLKDKSSPEEISKSNNGHKEEENFAGSSRS